jgi:hypothetical protein
VLDVDVKDGRDGFAVLAVLGARYTPPPHTWRSRTPSGGAHVFYRTPSGRVLRNRANIPVPGFTATGLDVRADGGFVVLPPSRKPSGAYVWEVDPLAAPLASAPEWLLDLVDPPTPARHSAPRRRLTMASLNRTARYVCAAVNRECDALGAMPPGSGRNQQLFKCAARFGSLIAAGVLPQDIAEAELEDAATRCGLTGEDGLRSVRATIASGFRHGVSTPAAPPA